MKLLLRKFANSSLGIKLRNTIGFEPVPIIIDKKFRLGTISDAFFMAHR